MTARHAVIRERGLPGRSGHAGSLSPSGGAATSNGHVIHFTNGIHPAARVTRESFIEDMRARGNNAVGLGVPFWLPGGGENHPDAILSQQSLWIDSYPIVQDGVIVEPPALAKAAEKLVPRTGAAR